MRPPVLPAAALTLATAVALAAGAAPVLPPVAVAYTITARFDPTTRGIDGRETIRWRNTSGEAIAALPLHLYLNAFAHTGTTWMREADFRDDVAAVLRISDDPWGYDEPRRVRQSIAGALRELQWRPVRPDDGNPLDRTLVEIELAAAAAPGEEVVLEIEFDARLPLPFARTGQVGDFALFGQWYPKLGVIEPPGTRGAPRARSAARQFHGATEFYADYADYDVTLVAPAGWLVAATGRRAAEPSADGRGNLAHRYVQRAVNDFALVAGASLVDAWQRVQPAGGGPAVDVRYVTPRGTEHQFPRWQKAIATAFDVLGQRVGPYPYDVLTVVLVPHAALATRGMEYPTFVTGERGDPLWDRWPFRHSLWPEHTLAHEFAHQYFYALVGTNEQDEAFLDEGFATYWEARAMNVLSPGASLGSMFGRRVDPTEGGRVSLRGAGLREPIRREPSWLYAQGTWEEQLYTRPGLALHTAARLFGSGALDRVFREYVRRFAFDHPGWDDFLAVARTAGGADLAAFLAEAFASESVPDYRVVRLESSRWENPTGRIVDDAGTVTSAGEGDEQAGRALLEPAASARSGPVLGEVRDPGWTRGDHVQPGHVERRLFEVSAQLAGAAAPAPAGPAPIYESTVRFEGPAWDTLPVQLEFRFDDGSVVTERWDGRAPWREYRFWRASRLALARVDARDAIALDPDERNNALAREPAAAPAADWSLWIAALAQAVAAGIASWL
ncbi:MAG: M1 family metallopeptidase [Acidobacteria bacterium]|nr:M1 family metallopeptidase [Acidobacteriota bacterium]